MCFERPTMARAISFTKGTPAPPLIRLSKLSPPAPKRDVAQASRPRKRIRGRSGALRGQLGTKIALSSTFGG